MPSKLEKDEKKHGGGRKGSGRKKGKLDAKTLIARKRTEEAIRNAPILPLEVMLQQMREAHEAAAIEPDPKEKLNHQERAAERAKDAAPYVHPKLQPVNGQGSSDQTIHIDNVEAILKAIDGKTTGLPKVRK